MPGEILTVNVGSSSVKVALFEPDGDLRRLATAEVRRDSADDGVDAAFAALPLDRYHPRAVAHRVVHGGTQYTAPVQITPDVLEDLRELEWLAPDHLAQSIEAIRVTGQAVPHVPQVACFDTAFHQHMPTVARMFPLPRRFWDAGVRRYGFHGLSCESVLDALRGLDREAARGRLVVAHLGGGSSLTAIRDGVSVETTMGFSPAGGVMMGSRSGDLDPGVVLHVLHTEGSSADDLRQLVTREAGLRGVSGRSADMRELLASEASEPAVRDAIDLYCYLIRKALGALMAVLGGLDTLIFTGGIGERAAPIRDRVVAGLSGLGLHLDPARNHTNAPVISSPDSAVTIRVMPSDEDRVLASYARALLARSL